MKKIIDKCQHCSGGVVFFDIGSMRIAKKCIYCDGMGEIERHVTTKEGLFKLILEEPNQSFLSGNIDF